MNWYTNFMNKLETAQKEHASKMSVNLKARETATIVGAAIINEVAPTQNSNESVVRFTRNAVNVLMSDYDNTIEKEGFLSKLDKDFLPQPGMLSYWSEKKGFSQIEANGDKLNTDDVQDKYVLTYYPPFAKSWAERTTDDITDTTNKHWYSHCKSSLYDNNSKATYTSNPELNYNDTVHDATAYVPEDSMSYAINYKELGLSKEAIEDGFAYENQGINVMDPNVQQSIFKMQKMGLSRDDIISLWQNKVNLTDANNLSAIEQHMKNGGDKDGIKGLELATAENKPYFYNLQDYSCAIRPTAPVLYATAAKIDNEQLNDEQADALRKDIGLYNIYDRKNYEKINDDFYKEYVKDTVKNYCNVIKENLEEFADHPLEKIKEAGLNLYHGAAWASAKTLRYIPEAAMVIKDIYEKETSRISKLRGTKDNTNKAAFQTESKEKPIDSKIVENVIQSSKSNGQSDTKADIRRKETKDYLKEQQTKHASEMDEIPIELRDKFAVEVTKIWNEYLPKQDGDERVVNPVMGAFNMLAYSNYGGTIGKEKVLADKEQDFLPLPGMLSYWSDKKGFSQIKPTDEKLDKVDVQDKYVLTYYPPLAKSWTQNTTSDMLDRTENDVVDKSNKHWYSHCKSSLYDENSNAMYTTNPDTYGNDSITDATEYVADDTISYAIDYKKLGLNKEDIEEGFAYENQGINIMDPKIQQSIFKMQKMGLSRDDIISLWHNKVNLTDENNLSAIEQHMKNGGNKDGIKGLELATTENDPDVYNLQRYSCAIRPTAPILYATAARIEKEQMSHEQADALRKDIGLYNIYDKENYGQINDSFCKEYFDHVDQKYDEYIKKYWNEFKEHPLEKIKEAAANFCHGTAFASAKMSRHTIEAGEIRNMTPEQKKKQIDILRGTGKHTNRTASQPVNKDQQVDRRIIDNIANSNSYSN